MKYPMLLLIASLALPACNRDAQKVEPQPSAPAAAKPAETAPAKAAEAAPSVPKLGKLDEVDYETLKKRFRDAGWQVSGSATRSAMVAITLNLAKDGVEIELSYYKNGGPSWEQRLEKQGATIHKAGDVLVGVTVQKGNADPKKILEQLVG